MKIMHNSTIERAKNMIDAYVIVNEGDTPFISLWDDGYTNIIIENGIWYTT